MSQPSDQLRGSYNTPTASHGFSKTLAPLPAAPSTKDTTAYLGSLRKAAAQMQTEVNAFLTSKMEQDKQSPSNSKVDESKEEQYYGEEHDDDET